MLDGISIPTIGVICGCDAVDRVIIDTDVVTRSMGNNDSLVMLKKLLPQVEIKRMHVAPSYFRQQVRYNFAKCDLLWNAISDEDQNPKTLAVAGKIVDAVKIPVVNPPKTIRETSRSGIARMLKGIDGVIAPKVLTLRNPTLDRVQRQVDAASFRFPAIVRRTGTHNGDVVGLFPTVESLEPIFGDRKNEYFLIEYVDVRHADGHYRKTRFFFVGDQAITRQHIVSDQWSVHGRSGRRIMSERADLLEESRRMLTEGFASLPEATQAAVHRIRERVGLDYGGLDCCILEDGRVVLFECNATMNFNPWVKNPKTAHNMEALPRAISAMRRLIHAKTGMGPTD